MYWLFYPGTPVEIHELEIVDSNNLYAGEEFTCSISYTKERAYPILSVSRQLIGDTVIVLTGGSITPIPVGTHTLKEGQIIPGFVDPGKWVYCILIYYQVNPLRIITVKVKSKPFMIKKRRLNCGS
jgi:hypothetical protein